MTTTAIITYNIVATQPSNGTITPSGTTTVNYNANQAYTVTPNSTYQISKVTVDSVNYTSAGSYLSGALTISIASGIWTVTFVGVKAAHTITATIILIPTYNLTITIGTGYTITIGGTTYSSTSSVSFNAGVDIVMTINITTGYLYQDLVINGNNIYPMPTFTLKNIQANSSVSVVVTTVPDQRIYNSLVTYDRVVPVAYSASIAYAQGALVTYNSNTYIAIGVGMAAGTTPGSDGTKWELYGGDVVINNVSGTWSVYQLAAAQVPYGTALTNTSYFTLVGTLSGQGTPPIWTSTDVYNGPNVYIMYKDANNIYHVAKVQWWSQNDDPNGTDSNIQSNLYTPNYAVNPNSINWSTTPTYIANDTVMRANAMFVAQSSVAANSDPETTNTGAGGTLWKFQQFASTDIAWVSGKTYNVGAYCVYLNKLYVAVNSMTSATGNRPDVDYALDSSKDWKWIGILSF